MAEQVVKEEVLAGKVSKRQARIIRLMTRRGRVILLMTLAAAVITFAVVQDRVTAAGARRYVALQRDAAARGDAPVSIDEVVAPAVRRSVRLGLIWGGAVLAAGVTVASFAGRRSHGE